MKTQILLILILILGSSVFSHAQFFQLQNPAYAGGFMKSIYAVDTNVAYIAGVDAGASIIQKTIDGGQTWILIDSTNGNYDYSVCFYDADTGYVAGTTVRKTTDGGNTWLTLNTPSFGNYSNSIYIKNASDIWVIGPQTKFLHSIDYGQSWMLDSLNNCYMYDIIFVDSNIGFISGEYGVLYKTTDGGNSWNQINIGTTNDLWSLAWSGSRLFVLSGYRVDDIQLKADSICYTDDLINWYCQRLDTSLNNIVFVNDTVGYGTGTMLGSSWTSPGHVLRTTNKGQSWEMIYSAPNPQYQFEGCFYQLSFADENTGWVMGQEGQLFKTSNGMETILNKIEYNTTKSYPNPCNDKFFIETNQIAYTNKILLTDILGKSYNCPVKSIGDKMELNISELKSGTYFYKIVLENQQVLTGKFIKI